MSDLYAQIEEEEKALIEEGKDPDVAKVEEEPTIAEVEEEQEEKVEEKAEEKEEESPDKIAFARMRRENAALQRQIDEIKAAQVKPVEKVEAVKDPEPDKELDPEAHLAWELKQTKEELNSLKGTVQSDLQERQKREQINAAIGEFQAIEERFKTVAPDYDKVAEHFRVKQIEAMETLYPHATKGQIEAAVTTKLLHLASDFVNKGLDPAEEIYNLSKQRYGYKAPVEKPKIDLDKIEKNKARSASPIVTGGQSGGVHLTAEAVANMSMGEFSKLTPAQLAELERAS